MTGIFPFFASGPKSPLLGWHTLSGAFFAAAAFPGFPADDSLTAAGTIIGAAAFAAARSSSFPFSRNRSVYFSSSRRFPGQG